MARLAGILSASAVTLAIVASIGCSPGPITSEADPVEESTAAADPAPERGTVTMYQDPT